MAAPSVSFNGSRVNASDANTNWSNWGSSGPTPAAEAPLAYQNSLAVNKKINSTSLGGLQYNPGSGGLDMTGATYPLFFVKVYVSDSFDLSSTYGVNIGIGSANNAYDDYNIAGSNSTNDGLKEYPQQGGYILTAIAPNISGWEVSGGGSGTPTLTAVDWFGAQAAFNVGTAKAENLALDAIDLGTGLTVVDGVGADADFLDFVAWDQGTTTNRYGVVSGSGSNVTAHGLLTIGSSGSATEFLDITSIVSFPDGMHGTGLVGVRCDIQNASSVVEIGSLLIGGGRLYTTPASTDTRPDFTVVGTSGSFEFYGQMRNFNAVTFTSVCDVHDFDVSIYDLTQASADIYNGTIRTTSAASTATLTDPTFGSTTDLHDVEFIQAGAGHALEISGDSSYTFTNLTFSGYNASNGQSDSAIQITGGTGTTTINVTGGTTPSYRYTGTGSVVINNNVSVNIDTVETDGSDENGVQVLLLPADGTNYKYQAGITSIARSTTTATVTTTAAHGLSSNDYVVISGVTNEGQFNGVHQITVTGTTTFTYTVADTGPASGTGTMVFTYVLLYGTTASGTVSSSVPYIASQSVIGKARKSSTGDIYFKTSPIIGTLTSTGFSTTVTMVRDQ